MKTNVMPETLATPRFVLKHELQSIGPSLCGIESAQYSYVLYGFSDKPNYDLFRSEDSRLLKPYPLVKRFMMVNCTLEIAHHRLSH